MTEEERLEVANLAPTIEELSTEQLVFMVGMLLMLITTDMDGPGGVWSYNFPDMDGSPTPLVVSAARGEFSKGLFGVSSSYFNGLALMGKITKLSDGTDTVKN